LGGKLRNQKPNAVIEIPVRHDLFLAIFAVVFLILSTPSLTAQSRDQRGKTIPLFSNILNEERTLYLSLPENYTDSPQTYPVLYVLDAEGTKTFPQCVSTVDALQEQGNVPPMLVVGILNTDRNRDMIPVAVSHRPGSGGSENFLAFIKEELVPFIQKNYRTGNYSILYGMSNSALFAVYALLESPDVFSSYIASSPMIGHCPDFIESLAEAFVLDGASSGRILYMIYGENDSPRVTDFVPKFHSSLESQSSQNFTSELVILEGEGHVPPGSLKKGLEFIYSRKRN